MASKWTKRVTNFAMQKDYNSSMQQYFKDSLTAVKTNASEGIKMKSGNIEQLHNKIDGVNNNKIELKRLLNQISRLNILEAIGETDDRDIKPPPIISPQDQDSDSDDEKEEEEDHINLSSSS